MRKIISLQEAVRYTEKHKRFLMKIMAEMNQLYIEHCGESSYRRRGTKHWDNIDGMVLRGLRNTQGYLFSFKVVLKDDAHITTREVGDYTLYGYTMDCFKMVSFNDELLKTRVKEFVSGAEDFDYVSSRDYFKKKVLKGDKSEETWDRMRKEYETDSKGFMKKYFPNYEKLILGVVDNAAHVKLKLVVKSNDLYAGDDFYPVFYIDNVKLVGCGVYGSNERVFKIALTRPKKIEVLTADRELKNNFHMSCFRWSFFEYDLEKIQGEFDKIYWEGV